MENTAFFPMSGDAVQLPFNAERKNRRRTFGPGLTGGRERARRQPPSRDATGYDPSRTTAVQSPDRPLRTHGTPKSRASGQGSPEVLRSHSTMTELSTLKPLPARFPKPRRLVAVRLDAETVEAPRRGQQGAQLLHSHAHVADRTSSQGKPERAALERQVDANDQPGKRYSSRSSVCCRPASSCSGR